MKILILDNYDSFTYNLFQLAAQLDGAEVEVFRKDEISLKECERFSHFIISPGPGLPKDAGITMELIEKFHKTHPIFGVCLGFQAMAEFFGGQLFNQKFPAHGIQRPLQIVSRLPSGRKSKLLENIPDQLQVGLYHSWAVSQENFPQDFEISALSESGIVMAMEHKTLPLAGVQFHPESIMTEHGLRILAAWAGWARRPLLPLR